MIMRQFKAIAFILLLGCITANAHANLNAAADVTVVLARFAVLSVDKTAYDFGEVEQGAPVTATFTITNSGDAPLKLLNVKGSCGCTVVDYTQTEIAPGATGTVEATYNAKKMGAFNKTVTVTSNAKDPVQVLRITGEVI